MEKEMRLARRSPRGSSPTPSPVLFLFLSSIPLPIPVSSSHPTAPPPPPTGDPRRLRPPYLRRCFRSRAHPCEARTAKPAPGNPSGPHFAAAQQREEHERRDDFFHDVTLRLADFALSAVKVGTGPSFLLLSTRRGFVSHATLLCFHAAASDLGRRARSRVRPRLGAPARTLARSRGAAWLYASSPCQGQKVKFRSPHCNAPVRTRQSNLGAFSICRWSSFPTRAPSSRRF